MLTEVFPIHQISSLPQTLFNTILSVVYSSVRTLRAKERGKGGGGWEDAIFFEVSRPAVYLINLYEIFLPKCEKEGSLQ